MGFDVKDQVCLVTGANRGIGKVITEALLAKGAAKVYAAVRNPSSAAGLVEEYGDRVEPLTVDLAAPETISAAAQKAQDVNLVINNAGVLKTVAPLDDAAIEALQFEMDVNVYGLLRVAQAFAPVLKSNGGGALVQLNSVASLRSFADFSTYCASKAASYSITQSLRDKLAEQGTAVLSVHPGPIDTDMADEAGLKDSAESPQLVADAIIAGLSQADFHAFPDSFAKQVGAAYQSFAENVIEADSDEG